MPVGEDFVHGDFTFEDVEGDAMLRKDLCCICTRASHYIADCQRISRSQRCNLYPSLQQVPLRMPWAGR